MAIVVSCACRGAQFQANAAARKKTAGHAARAEDF
jgi:hypothetical protein